MFHPEYISPKKLINNDDIVLLFQLVEKHGGVLRFVGGAVRDAIAGIARSDIDLVTDLSPLEFSDMCDDEGVKCVPIGIQFFTLGVFIENSFFKVTCLSSDEDGNIDEWKKDAAKRDLTINAVYADEKGNVFDYYNGIKDLENGVIKFIGKPQNAIEYDYIRIMRFFRFCAIFGKKIDRKSLKSCIENKNLLHKVSLEKIKEEFFKILMAPYAHRALKLLFDHGVLDFMIAPPKSYQKFENFIQLEQEYCLKNNIVLRLYALFEPSVRRAERLAKIFRLTKEQKDLLLKLAGINIGLKEFKDTVSLNKFIFKYGKDFCRNLLLLTSSNGASKDEIQELLNTLDSTLIPVFPITGKDLINIGADKKFLGLYMDVLKKEWFESGCVLSKEELFDKFRETFKC